MSRVEEKLESKSTDGDDEYSNETTKEDWNKFVIASTLCCVIILVQIVLSFYEF